MNMSNVKAITIPEGTVKKIENSNGNIIWGSYDAFPYRRLEYVDIPANAYVNLNSQGDINLGLKLDINLNPLDATTQQSGNFFGSIYYNGSTYYRYHLSTTNTGLFQSWFGTEFNSYVNTDIYSNDNNRYYIELNSHTAKDKKLYIDNVQKGTYNTSYTTQCGLVYIGGRRFNNNGTITINDYPRTIRVYYVELVGPNITTNPNDTSKIYPVQRKSDGKIGLLKLWNHGQAIRFCTTETSTELIAGPVVDEYYEGTDWI